MTLTLAMMTATVLGKHRITDDLLDTMNEEDIRHIPDMAYGIKIKLIQKKRRLNAA